MKFEEWFNKKLSVGRMPDDFFELELYDFIINVSDEYMPLRPDNCFWFPMNERKKDIGLNSIYGALTILERAYKSNRSVYLHCHAGVNRSKTVAQCFYYNMTGKHLESEYNNFYNVLHRNCAYGYLPNIVEMGKFLQMMNDGSSLDRLKLKTLINF